MKKNILLPTDFSDNAWSAAIYALQLYAKETCTFYFLHATKMKVSRMSNMTNKLMRVMSENALKELHELKKNAEQVNVYANHEFHIILSSDTLEAAIEDQIKNQKIDLVVMGTKGATKAEEIFFGSNTVSIINKMKHCPTLVVPDEFHFVIPKKIAFPTDFNHFYDDELLSLKHLTTLHSSKINIIHINEKENLTDEQNYNLAMLEAYLENHPHTFHWKSDAINKTVEINDFIKEQDINILAIVKYKHSFIENIINEPIIKKIGFHPIVPFLVIPGLN